MNSFFLVRKLCLHTLQFTSKRTFGSSHFDFLINNAGTSYTAPIEATTESKFDEMMNIYQEMFRLLLHQYGMFRLKGELFNEQYGFRKLITAIHKNLDKSPAIIFDEAKRVSNQVKGAGPNFIGEMMMTYSPRRLANINQNPITVLREEVKADIKLNSFSYNGADYEA